MNRAEKGSGWIKVGENAAVVLRTARKGIQFRSLAGIAQLVERDLAKVEVAGSNPVSRSNSPWFRVWPSRVFFCSLSFSSAVDTPQTDFTVLRT